MFRLPRRSHLARVTQMALLCILPLCVAMNGATFVSSSYSGGGLYHHRALESVISKPSSANSNDGIMSGNEECKASKSCEMCTFSDQKTISACKATGRMQLFECVSLDGSEAHRTEIRSCSRTEADDQFSMIQLQMFCVLVGSMAFASVRRQKRLSASLFDQRKQGAQMRPRGRRDSDAMEVEIEFSKVDTQETVPLVDTSNNPLEII